MGSLEDHIKSLDSAINSEFVNGSVYHTISRSLMLARGVLSITKYEEDRYMFLYF